MSTIAAAMIVRDGNDTLDRCLASICDHVNEIVIGIDDRTIDDSEATARRYNATVFPFHWIDDFSYARNLVAEQVKSDWIFVVDADDYLVSGGEHLIPPDGYLGGTVTVHTGPGSEMSSCRVYRRGSARYKYQVHEYPVFTELKVTSLPVVISHARNKLLEPGRNLRILQGIMDEYPRYLFYFGRECIKAGRYEDGISALSCYLQLHPAEKYQLQAIIDIARAHYQLERIPEAKRYSFLALEINQNFQPAYVLLGQIAYSRQEFQVCVNWLESALNLKQIDYLFNNIRQDTFYIYDLLMSANFFLNNLESSEKYLDKCLAIDPENERFLENKKCIKEVTTFQSN